MAIIGNIPYFQTNPCLKWWHHQPGILGPLDILLSKDISKLIRAGTTEPKRIKPEIFSDRRGSFKVVTAEEGPWSWSDENFIKLSPEKNDQSWYYRKTLKWFSNVLWQGDHKSLLLPICVNLVQLLKPFFLSIGSEKRLLQPLGSACARKGHWKKPRSMPCSCMPMLHTHKWTERDASHLKLNFSKFFVSENGLSPRPTTVNPWYFPICPLFKRTWRSTPHPTLVDIPQLLRLKSTWIVLQRKPDSQHVRLEISLGYWHLGSLRTGIYHVYIHIYIYIYTSHMYIYSRQAHVFLLKSLLCIRSWAPAIFNSAGDTNPLPCQTIVKIEHMSGPACLFWVISFER